MTDLLDEVDAVLVTHTHQDHWDQHAQAILPRTTPIFCQPADQARIEGSGFSAVYPIEVVHNWRGVQISRSEGKHGAGELAERLGPVSGFLLRAVGEPTLYLAGDTVWCEEVEQVLRHRGPDAVVLNAGAAQFLHGGPITMDMGDVIRVCEAAPNAHVIAVHMESINHCMETRSELTAGLKQAGLEARAWIPSDGDLSPELKRG